MKFYMLTLGCQMNTTDSGRVKTVLNQMGFEETEDEDSADIIGVMACSVRQKAIDRIYSLVYKWNKWKEKKSLITFISGCILPFDRERFLKKFDLLFSINELPTLPTLLQQYGITTPYSIQILPSSEVALSPAAAAPQLTNTTNTVNTTDAKNKTNDDIRGKNFWNIAPTYASKYEAFVSIQNGCDKFCTFCAVPYTRGREVSRPSSEILKEIYTLMQSGYTSITLLGQNVNSYGLDTQGTEMSFAQLLERIGNMAKELSHDCWVYFTSPHPRDMTREVLEVIAAYPALAKQIHLPLQSGDDKLLIKMNRAHSMVRYDTVMQDIYEILPDATIFTDIIVGFCGETEEQFERTAQVMEKYKYSMAYIAIYSPRPGATSARWKDDVPMDTKKYRFRYLSDILIKTTQEHNKKKLGTEIRVLLEKIQILKDTEDNKYASFMFSAKTEGRVPVQAKIPHSLLQSYSEKEIEMLKVQSIGKFITVRVIMIQALSLICEIQTMEIQTIETEKSK